MIPATLHWWWWELIESAYSITMTVNPVKTAVVIHNGDWSGRHSDHHPTEHHSTDYVHHHRPNYLQYIGKVCEPQLFSLTCKPWEYLRAKLQSSVCAELCKVRRASVALAQSRRRQIFWIFNSALSIGMDSYFECDPRGDNSPRSRPTTKLTWIHGDSDNWGIYITDKFQRWIPATMLIAFIEFLGCVRLN